MKRTTLFFILLLISVCVFANEPEWQWVETIGGIYSDRGMGITVDHSENLYITGYFIGTITLGEFVLTSSNPCDIFVAKIDINRQIEWAVQSGGSWNEYVFDIAVDCEDNVYIVGSITGIATFGNITLIPFDEHGPDIFVAKIDKNGNWIWAKNAGGNSWEQGYSIAIDNSGDIYITGYFGGTAVFGTHTSTCNGYFDVFVAKLDTNGNWIWAKNAGGDNADYGLGLVFDIAGYLYVTGRIKDDAYFGNYTVTSNGSSDCFIAKIDLNGNWIWARNAGDSTSEKGLAITADNLGNIYATGIFEETATFGSYNIVSNGEQDLFVTKIDANGNWQWAKNAGGIYDDFGYGIGVNDSGFVFVTGSYRSTATFGPLSLLSNGSSDAFIAKLDINGNWLWVKSAGGSGVDVARAMTTHSNNIYIIGYYTESAIFGSSSIASIGDLDVFIAKLSLNLNSFEEIYLTNYPNPFNINTTFLFIADNDTKPIIEIYNMKGQKIRSFSISLPNQIPVTQNSRFGYTISWHGDDSNGNKVGSGVYFCRLKVNGKTKAVKKCLLMK